ncbi:hypothetical protein KN815_21545 [Streptomyces sp. 4503]|uniref:Chaplin domain-containing protein n=1 Tax=Streptomyces niphimycinicus TaxID=2842201 RepID=A0ABS6CI87_9ACTN|nr:hypothetical protein [Streptomyces niphimycinicus]MBU3866554.1 hypothetical protein [Streptomyces niphimycinicus]
MQIAKKAALVAATAGALALLGTGTAAAGGGYGGGSDRNAGAPTSLDVSSFIFQSNHCNTSTGTTLSSAVGAPTGEMKIGSTCANIIGG